jgi:hypothetical protein
MCIDSAARFVGVWRQAERGNDAAEGVACLTASARHDVASKDIVGSLLQPAERGLRVALRHAEDGGKLDGAEALPDAEVEQCVITRIQRAHRLPDQVGAVLLIRTGGVDAGRIGNLERAERLLVGGLRGGRVALLGAGDRAAIGGGEEAGAEVRALCRERLQRRDERGLGGISRRAGVAECAPREVVDAVEVAVVQLAEAVEVASAGPADKQLVVQVSAP